MPKTPHTLNFRKSSYSGGQTQSCVEVADSSEGRLSGTPSTGSWVTWPSRPQSGTRCSARPAASDP